MDWNTFLRSIKRKWESNEEEFEENYRKRKWDEEAIEIFLKLQYLPSL